LSFKEKDFEILK